MGLRINSNGASQSVQRALRNTTVNQAKSYERLASGNRITQAGDDAAGLAISENLRAQVRSMGQAERNANDGMSFVQVAEGGLTEIGNIMIRLRELAIQASSDTVGDRERAFINGEVKELTSEVDRLAQVTNFNGTALLNGGNDNPVLQIQVGIRKEKGNSDQILFDTSEYNVTGGELGIKDLDYSSLDGARDSLDTVDTAIGKVFGARARLGATQNRLQSTINGIGVMKENLEKARSRIADTDVASEVSEMVKTNILQQAGVATLAQANQVPNTALRLL